MTTTTVINYDFNITIMVNIVTPRDYYTNKQINKLMSWAIVASTSAWDCPPETIPAALGSSSVSGHSIYFLRNLLFVYLNSNHEGSQY